MLNTSLEDGTARVIMLSGPTRGIGRATAARLHAAGFALSLGARDAGALVALTADWPSGSYSLHHFDALDTASQADWVSHTVDQHGRIDGLVNNAGVLAPFDFQHFQEDSLDIMWAINVKTPARLAHLALPHLRAAGDGRIVNMASLSGKRVNGKFEPGYAMTKHAVVALTAALRQEFWSDGVRATAICPSFVDTEMIAGADPGPEPIIDPADVAELIHTALCLPGSASVAELTINCRVEAGY